MEIWLSLRKNEDNMIAYSPFKESLGIIYIAKISTVMFGGHSRCSHNKLVYSSSSEEILAEVLGDHFSLLSAPAATFHNDLGSSNSMDRKP